MNKFEYSIEAQEVKGLFYNKPITVYVEGNDDHFFWTKLFELAKVEAYIEEVGGSHEIEKKIANIVKNKAKYIVACDKDHSEFLDDTSDHSQIIRTYGYSIENSMYNLWCIDIIIQKFSRNSKTVINELEEWATSFINSLNELIIYDIANHKYKKGIEVFGDSCARFLENSTSAEISNILVDKFIANISNNFTESEITNIRILLAKSRKNKWFHIKGHFVTSGIINVIKYYVKKRTNNNCNISNDSLYALTIDCTDKWSRKIDIKNTVSKIKKINLS